MQLLQKWLSQPEARLFREQIAALAATKAIEAAEHLSGDDGSGVELAQAKIASGFQNQYEHFLELMNDMLGEGYQFQRVKIKINQELL